MNLIIDFLNVKEFSAETLLELHKKYGLYNSRGGQERGFEEYLFSRFYVEGTFYVLNPESSMAAELKEKASDLVCFPGEEKFQGFLGYLKTLQKVWAERIYKTITEGPNLELLNEVEEKVKVFFEPGGTRADVKPRYWLKNADFEDYLDFDYLHIFLTGQGETLQKLRTCKNPDCGKWFVYNRPKQAFCCNACRHRYNNHIKIKSGYLADHQRKGRAEKPSVYNY